MLDTLMMMAANIPQTGDNFPKGILIAVIIGAVILAVGTAVFAKRTSGSSDDDDEE